NETGVVLGNATGRVAALAVGSHLAVARFERLVEQELSAPGDLDADPLPDAVDLQAFDVVAAEDFDRQAGVSAAARSDVADAYIATSSKASRVVDGHLALCFQVVRLDSDEVVPGRVTA